MKRIKITETGYSSMPRVITAEIETYDRYVEVRGTMFRDNTYLRLTRAQARKMAKFLNEFAEVD